MLPVPDEQVVVAFENGDPSYPYVLGSVFNGKDKPGDEMAVADGSFAMKSDHKALIAAKEDINLRTEKGKWVIEVKGGEIKETVNQGEGGGGAYTGKFDGKWGLTATQAIETGVAAERQDQGAADRARGRRDDDPQGQRPGVDPVAGPARSSRARRCRSTARRWLPSLAASSTSDRFGTAMTELLGSGLSFPLSVDRRGGIALATGEQDVDQAIEIILTPPPANGPCGPSTKRLMALLISCATPSASGSFARSSRGKITAGSAAAVRCCPRSRSCCH